MSYKNIVTNSIIGLICTFSVWVTESAHAITLDQVLFRDQMRVGVFIGTFSPPHIAHRQTMELALDSGLDYVVILPNDLTWHKPSTLSLKNRNDMACAEYANHPKIVCVDPAKLGHPLTFRFFRYLSAIEQKRGIRIFRYGLMADDVAGAEEHLLNRLWLWNLTSNPITALTRVFGRSEKPDFDGFMVKQRLAEDKDLPIIAQNIRNYFGESVHVNIFKVEDEHPVSSTELRNKISDLYAGKIKPEDIKELHPEVSNLILARGLYRPRSCADYLKRINFESFVNAK